MRHRLGVFGTCALVCLAVLVVFLAVDAPVSAFQDTARAPEAAVATTVPDAGASTTTTIDISNKVIIIAILTFLFAAVVIALLLFYLRETFKQSLRVVTEGWRQGKNPTPRLVNATMQESINPPALAGRNHEFQGGAHVPLPPLKVEGPGVLHLNRPGKYKVTPAADASPIPVISWTAEPSGVDPVWKISPTEGQEVELTVYSEGALTLIATAKDKDYEEDRLLITAVAAEEAKPEPTTSIPFFGQGYGSQILAIVLLAFIVVLG